MKNRNITVFCCVCGTAPDGTKKAAKTQHLKDVGVTRRFSVGTFMIMTAFIAVLFSILTVLNTNPIVFCCIAVFFIGIGVAQMALFGGNEPRKASWIAGFPLGFVCCLGGMIAYSLLDHSPVPFGGSHTDNILGNVIVWTILGGPCGYVAGCLIASIFLVRERESDKEIDSKGTFEDDEEDEDQ
ncbi:MAG: hypothetical protein ABSG67_16560 [Thermoguttaceae bacterium]